MEKGNAEELGSRFLEVDTSGLLAIWWSTRKERDQCIFEGEFMSLEEFKLYFQGSLYCCVKCAIVV